MIWDWTLENQQIRPCFLPHKFQNRMITYSKSIASQLKIEVFFLFFFFWASMAIFLKVLNHTYLLGYTCAPKLEAIWLKIE